MKKTQSMKRNLSMVMDFYELTMANGYFKYGDKDVLVAFDVFYRNNPDNGGFAIFAGLEQIIDYINELHFDEEDIDYLRKQNIFPEDFLTYLKNFKFKGSIYSIPEGTIMYPNTPILTIVAPLIDAQLIETAILLEVNHQSLIATKTRRIVNSAENSNVYLIQDKNNVSDFGARRAHNVDSAVYGARAAYIAGASSTATVLSGQMFDIPISGTMAHSWVMFFSDEYTAFKAYAETYPDSCTLLVDTYDVLESGIPNAIKVAKDVLIPLGKRLKGVRLDSGDLAYLSKKVRMMLDNAGLNDCKIIASNSLDEYLIRSLNQQGAKIDLYGVGERLITAKSDPVFGAVYKIVGVYEDGKWSSRIKISENIEKITNPGLKNLYRVYNENGYAIADLLTLKTESLDFSKPYEYIDPKKPWKKGIFENCTFKELQIPIFINGKQVYNTPNINEIRNYVNHQLKNEIWEEEQRFENPHIHYIDMSKELYDMKLSMLNKYKKE